MENGTANGDTPTRGRIRAALEKLAQSSEHSEVIFKSGLFENALDEACHIASAEEGDFVPAANALRKGDVEGCVALLTERAADLVDFLEQAEKRRNSEDAAYLSYGVSQFLWTVAKIKAAWSLQDAYDRYKLAMEYGPDNPNIRLDTVQFLIRAGQDRESMEHQTELFKLAKEPDDLVWMLSEIGGVYDDLENYSKAVMFYDWAVDSLKKFAKKSPDNSDIQMDLVRAYRDIAQTKKKSEDFEGALETEAAGLAILQGLIEAHPDDPLYPAMLGAYRIDYALTLRELKRWEDAREVYLASYEAMRNLPVSGSPVDTGFALVQVGLGDIAWELGKEEEARDYWDQARVNMIAACTAAEQEQAGTPEDREGLRELLEDIEEKLA